jgi:hypothetical protein
MAFTKQLKQMRKRSLMTTLTETRVRPWEHSPAVDSQVQKIVSFLAGTLGFVLVTLLAWAVLYIVR